jgi:hypothetical protein
MNLKKIFADLDGLIFFGQTLEIPPIVYSRKWKFHENSL